MSLFGPLLPSLVLERAAKATLQRWIGTYLAEVADQDGTPRGSLALPRSYPIASQFGRPEDQLPSIGIHCPGLAGRPDKDGHGLMRVKWRLEIGCLVATSTESDNDRVAKLYAAAIWGSIMQNPSLGGVAINVDWPDGGERYDVLDTKQTGRSTAFCLLLFDVELSDVRSTYGAPREPLDPQDTAHGDWPTVQEVVVDVQPRTD